MRPQRGHSSTVSLRETCTNLRVARARGGATHVPCATVAGRPVERAARIAFARNRVVGRTPDGVEYRFHCPDAHKFPAQFLWDSCWHAIALRHLDPAAARDELRTLLRALEPDGFLPHTILWHRPVRLSRRFHYSLQRRSDRVTRTIQPPFVAFAWELVAQASPDDPGFARRGGRGPGGAARLARARAEPGRLGPHRADLAGRIRGSTPLRSSTR